MHGQIARRLANRQLDAASDLAAFKTDVDNFYLLFAVSVSSKIHRVLSCFHGLTKIYGSMKMFSNCR